MTGRREGRRRIARGVALGLGLGLLTAEAARAALPAARPDRALYLEARQAASLLQASPKLQTKRSEWERVILAFRRVVARYPQSGYCDDSLLAVGDLYRQAAERFKAPRYDDAAVDAYRALVEEYPSSRLGEQALFSAFEIVRSSGDRKKVAEAARDYLDTFPDGKRAALVKTLARKAAPAQAAALPTPPPPGLAQIFNLRAWTGESATRVVIDLEREVPLRQDRISDPDRLYVDLLGTRLHPNLRGRSFPVGDGLLEKIRIAQNRDDVVRVVLDFKSVKGHNVLYLQDPTRLVIDVQGEPKAQVAGDPPPPPEAPTSAVPLPAEVIPARRAPALASAPAAPSPAPREAEARPARDEAPTLPARRLSGLQPPASLGATPAPRRAPFAFAVDAPLDRHATTSPVPPPPAPQPPQVNRAGTYSLARQLGLGARRIVIDPGHGGHDPGTIGHGGLQEKDLVLDVALRLEALVRAELGAEVIMTRSSDAFVPLEERTAIANSKGADLFLSIHANSSRSPEARGIETYFLNFAVDPHAEAVAARENAISAATLNDLQGLVKAIALNSKIDESRDFASSVQEALVANLRPRYPGALDRGVHTAPFYVLIGAGMPSILAEIAFVSHPEEEKLLRQSEYRDRIARSLLLGVRSYLEGLSRTQTRQLTGSKAGSTLGVREVLRR